MVQDVLFLVIINDKTMKTRVVLILAICFSLFNFVVLAQNGYEDKVNRYNHNGQRRDFGRRTLASIGVLKRTIKMVKKMGYTKNSVRGEMNSSCLANTGMIP